LEKQGIYLKTFTGKDIPRAFFSMMYSYYERTNDKFGPWGCKYLTKFFFEELFHTYAHRLLFVSAFRYSDPSLPIGMSLLVTKGDQLYGRYWGCTGQVNSLHFNTCYYKPIEWAIANKIQGFDPGAGGAHKIRRGFTAISNFSLHRFYDHGLQRIMQTHIDEINRLEQEQIDALNHELPFAQHLKN
jgi:predicted N-acyltransferase